MGDDPPKMIKNTIWGTWSTLSSHIISFMLGSKTYSFNSLSVHDHRDCDIGFYHKVIDKQKLNNSDQG